MSINNAIKLSHEFKNANFFLCLGGHHATFAAEEILCNSYFDAIVAGEGEFTILELVEALIDTNEIDQITGIYYQKNGKIYKTPSRKSVKQLDTLPFPDRSIPMFCYENNIPLILNIISSRGCPYNCSFCDIAQFYRLGGEAWRCRSPRNFVDEIEMLTRKFPNYAIRICDDNFIGYKNQKERIYQIAEEIIKRGIQIKFDIRCRADSFDIEKDKELIRLLKEAGLKSILLGVDGGCDTVLKIYNKRISAQQNFQMIQFLRKFKLVLQMGYIMFNPYLTLSDLKDQLVFFIKTRQSLFYQMTNRLEIYPGIALFQKLKEDGLIINYSHDNPYCYKYKDPRVKFLAENLSRVQPEMMVFDSLIQHIEFSISQLRE